MNTTDPCTGNFPLSPVVPVAFQNNRGGSYYSFGPISNFTAAMSGCCGSPVDIFDGGRAPPGCYYYCVFEGSQDGWEEMRDCIAERANRVRDRLAQQNITGNGFIPGGRSPDQVSSTGVSREVPGLGFWRCLVLGLAFAGGLTGTLW